MVIPHDFVPFPAKRETPRRTVVGIHIGTGDDRAHAVVASTADQGLGYRLQVEAAGERLFPQDTARTLGELASGRAVASDVLCRVAAGTAETAAALVRDLGPSAPLDKVLVVGVDEPGFWYLGDGDVRARIGLLDPARLAAATGLTVIDDFPARDVAHGGCGGPVAALALWQLLADPQRCRLYVELSHTTRIVYLPPAVAVDAGDRVIAMDAGPGMALLDRLAVRLTEGRLAFDPGGTLAVQGRQIPELLERLLDCPECRRAPPCWSPRGVTPDEFLDRSIRAALEYGWSMRDLLCTATHLIAESVARAVAEHIPKSPPLSQLIFAGGGRHNGLLLREIARRLPGVEGLPVDSLRFATRQLPALAAAVLTLMHLDHIPQSRPLTTGTETPRVLGRLTPGPPGQWQTVLRQLSDNSPTTMSLRSAV